VPLKNRRDEYSWPATRIQDVRLMTDKKEYGSGDTIVANLGFRLVGGLRESFHPDVWTVSWEDFDKIFRYNFTVAIGTPRGPTLSKKGELKKTVRKASFYWSRDPDLPYRIWAMIMHEDGSAPQIPLNVEDAQSKMLDVSKSFEVPASSLGRGTRTLVAKASVKWPRRSYIEKGSVTGTSNKVTVKVA
jgi:hypothetical protein